jgi:hypothetical protein
MRTLLSTVLATLVLAGSALAEDGSPAATARSRAPKARLDPTPAVLVAALAQKQAELHRDLLRAARTEAPEFPAPISLVAKSHALPAASTTQVAQH